jgi:hypothetical protein
VAAAAIEGGGEVNVMLRTDGLAKKFGHVEALESLPIRNLIWLAWQLPPARVVGGPKWLDPELYGADPGPSIFTAVQEQLGLRLDAGRGPVDELVIDLVDRPSGN